MKPLFSRSLGYGLIALGLLAGATASTQAGPLPQPTPATPALADTAVTPVRDSWAGGGGRDNQQWRWRNNGHWQGNGHWRGDGGWRGNRHWRRDDWRGRRHYRGGYDALGGFGLGLGLGLVAPRYYDDYYYAPPRRVYRGGLSAAHIRWCSARYRTYRAWDNTYVPRRGVRAICRSPFG